MLSPEEYAKRKRELEAKRAWKSEQRRNKLVKNVLLIVLGLVLMGVSAYYSYNQGLRNEPINGVNKKPEAEIAEEHENHRTHILFLGTDDKGKFASRTDTIILAALDLNKGEAGLISIPRDTRVYIPERDTWDRINAVHAYGGPEMTMKIVADFLDVNVDYYIETDFAGFSRIIDTLGGIEIDVEKDMSYTDTAQDLYIDIKAGKQILDGKEALDYVRYRDYLGDIALVNPQYDIYGGRVERQRKFVMALIDEVLQPSIILKLPKLISQLWGAVNTDLPWTLALKLAFAAERFTTGNIVTSVIPGTSDKLYGAWYWIPDVEGTKQVVDQIIHGIQPPLTAEVLNGSGVQGTAGLVSELLKENKVDVKRIGNADHFNYLITKISVSSKETADRAVHLAEKIGAELMIDTKRESPVDVTIIIGKDYQIP